MSATAILQSQTFQAGSAPTSQRIQASADSARPGGFYLPVLAELRMLSTRWLQAARSAENQAAAAISKSCLTPPEDSATSGTTLGV